MRFLALSLLVMCGGATSSGFAQTPATKCGGTPPALPPELAGWTSPAAVSAAAQPDGVERANLVVGRAAAAALSRTPDVHFVAAPDRPGGPATYGGMLSFEVTEAGTYRVALGSNSWIDVLEGGSPVASAAHGHGPECSGIRKIVDFSLKPGRHVLQLSGNADSTVTVLIALR